MKRYELSLKASYLPGWDLWAGLRELVQNARDAEVQYGASMKIEHCFRQRDKKPVGTVIITNEGTTIPIESFLIGHTSKNNRSDLIGKYGEGLKFGILALLRLGMDIKIRNGDQSWNPLITRSKDFDAEVLAFDVSVGNKFENRVQIEILGVSIEDWIKIQEKFLFVNPPHPASVIKVHGGQILLSPQHKGCLFVKGMFVCKNPQLFYGYDVDDADIDRDRRMVSNITEITAKLLSAALASGQLVDNVYELLTSGSPEVSNIHSYVLDNQTQEAIVDKFHKQYGEDAIPVEAENQITELGHLGFRGIKLPWNLQNIIATKLGTAKDIIAKLKVNARHTFEQSELTEFERGNFAQAVAVLNTALQNNNYPTGIVESIQVVEFNDPNMSGSYSTQDKVIRLARNRLQKVSSAMRTLIAESAHQCGPVGSKQHEVAIGNLTESTLEILLGR